MCGAPALSLDEYFADAMPWEEPIFRVIENHFATHGPDLIVDPLGIGILLKNGPMFAELRTKTKWTAVGFHLPRKVSSGRFSRKVGEYGKKYFHVINVDDPKEIDDEVLDWLTEAYHLAGGTLRSYNNRDRDVDVWSPQVRNSVSARGVSRASGGDGMVPNDVEDELF